MIAILFILFLIYVLINAAIEDDIARDNARRKGYSSYASNYGVRNVSDNKPSTSKNKESLEIEKEI